MIVCGTGTSYSEVFMRWQDFVLSIGVWVFIFALLPTLRAVEKPALETSIVTATTLIVFAIVYASMGWWGSVLSTIILGGMWYALAIQKYKSIKQRCCGGEMPY